LLDNVTLLPEIGVPKNTFSKSVYFCQSGTAERVARISSLGKWEGWFLETMTFAWDEAGLNEATAILDAVESWATFDLFKCKCGWAFDGGESSKDGFFPLDFFQRMRAKSLRRFYKNTPVEISTELESEIIRVRW